MSVQAGRGLGAFCRQRRRRAVFVALLVMVALFGLVPNAVASEGSVAVSVTLGCSNLGHIKITGLAENGTDTDVTVQFSIRDASDNVVASGSEVAPAGGTATYPYDSGQASVGAGSVWFGVPGSEGNVSYASLTCSPPDVAQPPDRSFGPIKLYVADPPDEQTHFDVWADCYHMVLTGFVAGEGATLRVTVQGQQYPDQTVDGGELALPFNFEWPVYGANAPYTVAIGGVVKNGTIDEECEPEPTEEPTSGTTTVTSTSASPTTTEGSTAESTIEATTSASLTGTTGATETGSTENTGDTGSTATSSTHEPPVPPGPYAQPSLSSTTPDCTNSNLTASVGGVGVVPASVVVAPGASAQLPVVALDGYYLTDGGETSSSVEVHNTFDPGPCAVVSSAPPSVLSSAQPPLDPAQPATPVCVVVAPSGIVLVADSQIRLVAQSDDAWQPQGGDFSTYGAGSGDTGDGHVRPTGSGALVFWIVCAMLAVVVACSVGWLRFRPNQGGAYRY